MLHRATSCIGDGNTNVLTFADKLSLVVAFRTGMAKAPVPYWARDKKAAPLGNASLWIRPLGRSALRNFNLVGCTLMNSLNELVFVSKQQVAKFLACSTRTVDREIARGRFPRPHHVGSRARFTVEDLAAYKDRLARERMERERHLLKAS
jgi:predicted DNA-binding transcriptional regulator AlpA